MRNKSTILADVGNSWKIPASAHPHMNLRNRPGYRINDRLNIRRLALRASGLDRSAPVKAHCVFEADYLLLRVGRECVGHDFGLMLPSNGNINWSGSGSSSRGFRHRLGGSEPGLSRPSATSRFIGEALPPHAHKRQFGALGVLDAQLGAGVMTEVELAQITPKMGFRNVMIYADDAPLQDAEIPLHGVGVDGAILTRDILAARVSDAAMVGVVPAEVAIDSGVIGHQAALAVGVLLQNPMDGRAGDVGNVERADAALALHKRNNRKGRAGACQLLGTVAGDVSLIGLHDLPSATKRRGEDVMLVNHGFTDAMSEEPCGLHGALQHPLDLAGADALLAGAHQMNDLQPQVKWQMGRLEDGPLANGELPFAGIALVQADPGGFAGQATNAVGLTAMRADGAVRPKLAFDVSESGFFGLKVRGVENGLGHG